MILTQRLLLRAWRDQDFEPYAAMNADPKVREFFPTLLTREESDAEARRIQRRHEREGFCLFAAELIGENPFIGFIGIQTMSFAVPGVAQPAIEAGWRLDSRYWGRGLATEGANAVLRHAFAELKLPRILAIAVPANTRSQRVMEKLGMRHLPELDFDHPHIAEGHTLRRHRLYSVSREDFLCDDG